MKVITKKKYSHIDYADVQKAKKLIINASNGCDQRDLPCNKKAR